MPALSRSSRHATASRYSDSPTSQPTISSSRTRPTTATEAPWRFSACGCTYSTDMVPGQIPAVRCRRAMRTEVAKRSRHELDIPRLRRWGTLAVPPAATQCLEQRGGVGITGGLGLDEGEQRRLIGVLGGEQPEIADGAELQLAPGDLEALEGSAFRSDRRFQGVGMPLHRVQRVGDIL